MKGRRVRNIVTRCNEITGLPQGQSDSSISHVHGQPSLVIVRDRILVHFCQAVISHDFFFFLVFYPLIIKNPTFCKWKTFVWDLLGPLMSAAGGFYWLLRNLLGQIWHSAYEWREFTTSRKSLTKLSAEWLKIDRMVCTQNVLCHLNFRVKYVSLSLKSGWEHELVKFAQR